MNATQAINSDVEFASKHGWVQLKEPTLFNFDKLGQSLVGQLLDIRTEQLKDDGGSMRDVLTMRFETGEGEQVKIRPSFDLRQKVGRRHLGRTMLIVWSSENAATEGKGNKMKIFEVWLAPEGGKSEPPTVITDDDLPPGI
jgi:hypothetical protein